jgi:hypothetical protein
MDNEDSHMNAMDVAFILATHNLDATPEVGYVIVKLDGMICSLTPNGEKSGLSDVATISNTLRSDLFQDLDNLAFTSPRPPHEYASKRSLVSWHLRIDLRLPSHRSSPVFS